MRRRSSVARIVALCALACLLGAGVSAARDGDARGAKASAETREGRLAIFDDVWETVRARYYDPALGGLDWAALGAEHRGAAADARGQDELYAVMRRMLAHLGDPHTRLHAPGKGADWRETRYVSVGVRLREVEGEVLVAEVERGSEAARAGVRAGDSLVRLDGEPTGAAFARRLEELRPSARFTRPTVPSVRQRAAARLFDGPQDTTVEAVFRGDGGRERRVALRRTTLVREPALRARREGRAGIVEFNLFTQETAAALARALKNDLRDAGGLVIDLRDNGGGSADAMTDAASLFLPPGRPLGRFTDRRGHDPLEPRTRSALLSSADSPARFEGRVVILVGPRTASAAEVFAAALKESGRASLVVGEQTCGCVLGIRRPHALPDGGTLDVSEMDYRTAAGSRLEGTGVLPDERVAPTRRSLREGKDGALRRALDILKAR